MAIEQGLSLLEIGPMTEVVPVGKKSLTVYGVSAEGIFSLFQRFPEMMQWFKGGVLDVPLLIKETPAAIAAVIAVGCGSPNDPKAEEVARKLPVEVQIDILEAIGRLTFSKGFGPFVKRIVALSDQARSANFGRGAGMKSPPASKPLSPPATEPQPPGS
jgi:hypothetical protein